MIHFKNVYKSFKGGFAVENLSLKINEGELFILLGESGSGKTTSLKMVNQLIKPDRGQLLVNNINVSEIEPNLLRKGIGYVMQYYCLFPHFTVKENISIVPQLLNWDRESITKRATELMSVFGLDPARFLTRYPIELSGGQQQRIGMIRALMASPPILLMDEPLGALDPVTRNAIRNEFKTLAELKKKTILMVTHDIQEAFMLADRIGLMFEGKLVQVGKPIDFLLNPASKMVVDFFKDQYFSLMMQCVTLPELLPDLRTIEKIKPHLKSKKYSIEPNESIKKLLDILGPDYEEDQLIEWESIKGAESLIISKEMLMTAYFRYLKTLAVVNNQISL